MAAGEAVPTSKVDCSVGSASILASTKNHQICKAVELPLSYSTVVQNPLHGQPTSSSMLTETHPHPNIWLADDIQKLKPFTIILGKPSFSFSATEKNQLVNNIKHVLIGKFSHGRPPMTSIKQFFANLKLQGKYNLSSFDSKHLYIECSNNIDFYRIWMKLVWNIKGYPMRVFQWSCDFSPRCESPLAPVWIRLEGIPLYLFDKMSLLSIANSIGKPICIDPRNLNRSMLNCALVCVELDVSKQLPNEVWIGFKDDTSGVSLGGFWVQVFYDFVPHFCSSCCHIGHNSARCKSRQQTALVGASAIVSGEASQQGGLASADLSPSQCTNSLVQPNLVSGGLVQPNLVSGMSVEKRQVSLLKGVVTHEVDKAQLQPSSVWLSANKRKVPSSKGKAGIDQEQAVEMSNRFGILEQPQATPCSLAEAVHPVSTIVTPTVLSPLNELHEDRPTNGASSEIGSQQQVALHTHKEISMVSSGDIGTSDQQQAFKAVVDNLPRNIDVALDPAELVQPTPPANLTSSNTKGEVQILKMLAHKVTKPVLMAPIRQQVSAIEVTAELSPVQVAPDVLAGHAISAGLQVTAQPSALCSQDMAASASIEYPSSGQHFSTTPKEQEDAGSDRIIEAGSSTSPVLLVAGDVQQIVEGEKLQGQREQLKAEGEVQQIAESPRQGKEQATDGSVHGILQQPKDTQQTTAFNQLKFCDEVEQRKHKLRTDGRSKVKKATKVLQSSKGILHRDGYWCDPNDIDDPLFHPYTRRLPKKVMKELGIF